MSRLHAARPAFFVTWSLLVAATTPASRGDEFERIEGDRMAALARSSEVRRHQKLTVGDVESLPAGLPDTRSAFLVVKTDQGNYTRLLVVPALRKPPRGDGPPLPVFLLERFDTFEPGKSSSRLARGVGLILFDGFQVDLDAGVVVPEGQGGDLAFRARGEGGPRLESLPDVEMFSLAVPIRTAASGPRAPTGKGIAPTDYAGRYQLFADGRWRGLLELKVDESRVISGAFRSEPNGTSYPVRGQVAESANSASFSVQFPRSDQEYQAHLWTEGKWAIAGTFVMLDRTFGFFAVREGVKLEPPR